MFVSFYGWSNVSRRILYWGRCLMGVTWAEVELVSRSCSTKPGVFQTLNHFIFHSRQETSHTAVLPRTPAHASPELSVSSALLHYQIVIKVSRNMNVFLDVDAYMKVQPGVRNSANNDVKQQRVYKTSIKATYFFVASSLQIVFQYCSQYKYWDVWVIWPSSKNRRVILTSCFLWMSESRTQSIQFTHRGCLSNLFFSKHWDDWLGKSILYTNLFRRMFNKIMKNVQSCPCDSIKSFVVLFFKTLPNIMNCITLKQSLCEETRSVDCAGFIIVNVESVEWNLWQGSLFFIISSVTFAIVNCIMLVRSLCVDCARVIIVNVGSVEWSLWWPQLSSIAHIGAHLIL